jgi:hypothetical protein
MGSVFHDWQTAMDEGREFQLLAMITDEEIARLGILASEVPQAPPPLPRHATGIKPSGLMDDEALEQPL